MKSLRTWLLGALLMVLVVGCDSADDSLEIDRASLSLGEWEWVPINGAQCRDGSPTGIGIRVQENATRLAIYLEGGGACFNGITCVQGLTFFGEPEFRSGLSVRGNQGVFDASNPENPLRDWNLVYVPYCTGDVHAGDAPDTEISSFGPQQFVGHRNMERYMDALTPAFSDQERVLLMGASAGGFGALFNFDLVAQTFGPITGTDNLTLLVDSGPVFADDAAFPPSLQQTFRTLWNFEETLPNDFPQRISATGDGLEGIYDYYSERYPAAHFGLFSHRHDETIRFFLGFAEYDGNGFPPLLDADTFDAALFDLRSRMPDNWATYFAPGADHTFLFSNSRLFGQPIAGKTANAWLNDLLDGTVTDVGNADGLTEKAPGATSPALAP